MTKCSYLNNVLSSEGEVQEALISRMESGGGKSLRIQQLHCVKESCCLSRGNACIEVVYEMSCVMFAE